MINHRKEFEGEIFAAKEILDYGELAYTNVKFIIAILHELEFSKDGTLSSENLAQIYKKAIEDVLTTKN